MTFDYNLHKGILGDLLGYKATCLHLSVLGIFDEEEHDEHEDEQRQTLPQITNGQEAVTYLLTNRRLIERC